MEPVRLTVRESECIRLAVSGLSDSAIANELGVTVRAVTGALHRSYDKLGVSGRGGAARVLHAGYTDDTRPVFCHPEARFGPAALAATAGPSPTERAGEGGGWWRPPPSGVLNRAGLVMGLSVVWLLIFAGALPALLALFDRVQQWWLRGA
ncbi:MAG: helix-turn-helix transcriptional regulator [Brevundimonas sp.]